MYRCQKTRSPRHTHDDSRQAASSDEPTTAAASAPTPPDVTYSLEDTLNDLQWIALWLQILGAELVDDAERG